MTEIWVKELDHPNSLMKLSTLQIEYDRDGITFRGSTELGTTVRIQARNDNPTSKYNPEPFRVVGEIRDKNDNILVQTR